MSESTPDFAALLGPFLARLDARARPHFLAALERAAARRYRGWSERVPRSAAGLADCATREEEIARTVERLLPMDDADRARIAELLPEAERVYTALFVDLPLREQWRIQAAAERAGGAAWRALAAQQADEAVRDALLGCAGLEEESALHLDKLVAEAS